jgi:hypothetical protein
MGLSQFAINNAKPKDRPYLLSDGDGLHLRIHPQGGRQWRLRFRFGGKANMMSLGPYPAVSLLQARKKRDRIKEQLAAGAMLDKARRNAIMLPNYNLEKRKDGRYFWKAPFFTAEAEPKGPYGSIMSACMMIARELAREATQRFRRK